MSNDIAAGGVFLGCEAHFDWRFFLQNFKKSVLEYMQSLSSWHSNA
ncbi:hypothetical protein AAKU61_002718 [Undibacterium sp. GrIS 1.2]